MLGGGSVLDGVATVVERRRSVSTASTMKGFHMKVDVAKLNWKTDPDFQAAERKLLRLEERETQHRNRLAELEALVRDAEASLVQSRVAVLMEESPSQAARAIQKQLAQHQREIVEIREELDAVELAKRKLLRAIEAAAAEAKLRLAEQLLHPYCEMAKSLRARLDEAVEINQQLGSIHALVVKQGLTSEIFGNTALKALSMPAAWTMLAIENGARNPAFQYWVNQFDSTFADR